MVLVALTLSAHAVAAEPPITSEFFGQASNQEELKGFDPLGPMVVMFSANWCEPCQMAKPHVQAFAKDHGWAFVYIDTASTAATTDAQFRAMGAFLMKYGIDTIPRYFVCDNGLVIDRVTSAATKTNETPDETALRIKTRLEQSARKMPN